MLHHDLVDVTGEEQRLCILGHHGAIEICFIVVVICPPAQSCGREN